MKVIIEGQVLSIFKADDFTNKESGEVTKGKSKIQLIVETELRNGEIKKEMKDISIPAEKVKEYEKKIGETVQVKCSFASNTPVNFWV